jgi:hypothetical protein
MEHQSPPIGRLVLASVMIGAFLATAGGATARFVAPEEMEERSQLWLFLGPGCDNCEQTRELRVNSLRFGLSGPSVRLRYDPEALINAVHGDELVRLDATSLGVRLVLSEVGPDRLLASSGGLEEAVGVLRTVRNRMDPGVWDPAGRGDLEPFPGCGPGARFQTCANPGEYLGLQTVRALDPASRIHPALLLPALDAAVLAAFLEGVGLDEARVADPTRGATSFEHRCGGEFYGLPASECSIRDASRGPILFLGPGDFQSQAGRHSLQETARIDFLPVWETPLRTSDLFLKLDPSLQGELIAAYSW